MDRRNFLSSILASLAAVKVVEASPEKPILSGARLNEASDITLNFGDVGLLCRAGDPNEHQFLPEDERCDFAFNTRTHVDKATRRIIAERMSKVWVARAYAPPPVLKAFYRVYGNIVAADRPPLIIKVGCQVMASLEFAVITSITFMEPGACAGLRIEGFWREHFEKCQTIVLPCDDLEESCLAAPSRSS